MEYFKQNQVEIFDDLSLQQQINGLVSQYTHMHMIFQKQKKNTKKKTFKLLKKPISTSKKSSLISTSI